MKYTAILQIARIYYPILAAVGIVVNFVGIVILNQGNCGLSTCITRYMLAMSSADLLLIILNVILSRINNLSFPITFLSITPVCALRLVLFMAAMDCSVWFTVGFTFDRFVAICCQKLRTRYCKKKTALVVIITVSLVGSLRSIPCYFIFTPAFVIDNVPWFCIARSDYYTSLSWKVYVWIDTVITPVLPIVIILVFNALTVRRIITANHIRCRLQLRGHGLNNSDPEVANRRKSIILLFALSANFILLWMPYVIRALIWQEVNYNYDDKTFNDPIFVFQEIGFMLRLLNSCTNTCVYALTQTQFREELINGAKYPFARMGKLCKQVCRSDLHLKVHFQS
ncbi:probable G-protein coupled receptor 139 [Stegostoma tigrinum]|uniref:probable G-protein coupled receptor 139 n=1 Tax=Stegostoma tigrinum TaxID=3053191 RepID=UPI00286FC5EB|nr:probable G-protein coupled receptor 139 [Stegostoma tigrinum]